MSHFVLPVSHPQRALLVPWNPLLLFDQALLNYQQIAQVNQTWLSLPQELTGAAVAAAQLLSWLPCHRRPALMLAQLSPAQQNAFS